MIGGHDKPSANPKKIKSLFDISQISELKPSVTLAECVGAVDVDGGGSSGEDVLDVVQRKWLLLESVQVTLIHGIH